ncbi:hypothetical protein AB0A74_00610 [Saccharothrix sp. NPDC042600]|uniref:hypothetical protein n=1 Tax=Saccharothrix TaxID=2071 RepID=UPI003409F0C6|nr:hypothetical protein GCM10017745_48060 [Saccharothrix mutabilis subsp. capreolus]
MGHDIHHRRAGTGLVLARDDVAAAGADYADRLSRPFATIGDSCDRPLAAAAVADARGSVLVMLPEKEFDFATANQLMRDSVALRLPVGVVPLPADPDAATETVARVVTRWRAPEPAGSRLALYCDFQDAAPAQCPWAFGWKDSDAFLDRLRSGVQAAVLHSHGNGADFRVGKHVLCVQAGTLRPPTGRRGGRFLPCQGGGDCRLDHHTEFVAFHGANAVRARLVVMLSCSAYQPYDGLLEPQFQFAHAMVSAGGHTAGLVASTRINRQPPQLGLAVARLLDAGASLGEIAMRINLLSPQSPSYLCVGDPDLSLVGP